MAILSLLPWLVNLNVEPEEEVAIMVALQGAKPIEAAWRNMAPQRLSCRGSISRTPRTSPKRSWGALFE